MKYYNAVVLGPSSSGKTHICDFLAKETGGRRISLDGEDGNGRMLKYTNIKHDEYSVPIHIRVRQDMINQIKSSKKPWFIDDIEPIMLKMLNAQGIKNYRVIHIIPSIQMLKNNIMRRNKNATTASNKRSILKSLSHYANFIQITDRKTNNSKTEFSFKFKDLVKIMKFDKHNFDKRNWNDKGIDRMWEFGIEYSYDNPPNPNKIYNYDFLTYCANTNIYILKKESDYNPIKKDIMNWLTRKK